MPHILNVGYASTNYYVLATATTHLLVDIGFPGTLPMLAANLRRKGMALEQIAYVLATHYHPDHAGALEELKACGATLIVLETQQEAVASLGALLKADMPFHPITATQSITLDCAASRAFLARLGLDGQVIATPGHSHDSVTLLLDDGSAFTGDLTPPYAVTPGDTLWQSWHILRERGATTVYPGHGPSTPFPALP